MDGARVRGDGGAVLAWRVAALALATLAVGCGSTERSPGRDTGVVIVPDDDQGFSPDALGDSGGLDSASDGGPDSASDSGPDAASDSGPDSGPDAPDTAADTEAPDASADPLAVPPDLRALACESFCERSGATCGFGALGGTQKGCEAACHALAAEDAWWLANYACYADSCDAARCALDGPPLSADPGCDAVCPALDQCDALNALDLPEDQPDLCRAACAGTTAATPAAAATYACILDALGPTCATDGLAACASSEPDPLCAALCARAYDPATPPYCAPGTAMRAQWPTAAACATACAAASPDPASAYRFAGCMDARGCGDLSPCTALPSTDPPACAAACAAIVTRCGSFGELSDLSVCTPYCTGRFSIYGAGPNPAAGTCITASTCPADPADRGGLWFRCLLPPDPDCDALCARLDTCKASFDPAFNVAGCAAACITGTFGPPDHVAAIAPCAAAEPCETLLACFPPAPNAGDPLCQPLCAHLTDTCAAPFDPKCNATCLASFAAGAEAYAKSTCRLVTACAAQPSCDPLAAAPIPAACVDACAASPLTCGGSVARCQGTCAGLLAGLPLASAAAPCVVNALASPCDPAAAASACSTAP